MSVKEWVGVLVQSRGKGLSQNHTAIRVRRVFDFVGRFSVLLALAFICYGFYVEQDRSKSTKSTAESAKTAAIQAKAASAQAKAISEENRRLALRARELAARVDALNKESRRVLLESQRGRRTATIQACARDRAEHEAIAGLLEQNGIPVPPALGPVDCKKRLKAAGLLSH